MIPLAFMMEVIRIMQCFGFVWKNTTSTSVVRTVHVAENDNNLNILV
jgi:hypothetical protein